MNLLNEVSEFCTHTCTLSSLLFGNLALSDEANELIFMSVHKFIRRSKRFEHTRKFFTYNNGLCTLLMHFKRVWTDVGLRVRHALRGGVMWAYATLGRWYGIPLPSSYFFYCF